MTARRAFFAASALFALQPVWARERGTLPRIGWLGNSRPDSPETQAIWDAFWGELGAQGWVEGRDLVLERRFAEGRVERFPALASAIVAQRPDVILASGGNAAAAARAATSSIPVVFAAVPRPVGMGLVASLARPGGNLTGFATLSDELIGKRMQLLKEAFPGIARVAVLSGRPEAQPETERAAQSLGLRLTFARAGAEEQLRPAIMAHAAEDAWFVEDDTLYFVARRGIVEAIAALRRPAMYPHSVFTQAGGLMSYAVDLRDQYRRAAVYVDRILRGASPAELPVQQPAKFEFVVNLKAGRAQGLHVAEQVLLGADQVIE